MFNKDLHEKSAEGMIVVWYLPVAGKLVMPKLYIYFFFFIRFLFNYNQMFVFTGIITRHTLMMTFQQQHITILFSTNVAVTKNYCSALPVKNNTAY